jgi:ParB family chromosome partitioning protein
MISEGHARALLAIGDERLMLQCYKQVLKENASVRRTEELVRSYREAIGTYRGKKGAHSRLIQTPQIAKWQTSLQQAFERPSNVVLQRSMRQTKVVIALRGNPDDTQADLDRILQIAQLPPDDDGI